MADTNKNQKFIEFYLAELLNHVKNTSEHRFQPAEFSAIKKTLVYLSHSPNPSEKIETLKDIPVLKPLYDFFNLVLNRFHDPTYRKSYMMASMEVDSEKVSQIFAVIFQSQALRDDLVSQLPSIGITLQFKLSKEKTVVKPESVPETTQPAKIKTETTVVTKDDDFKRVGDMFDFLTSRTRKFNSTQDQPVIPAVIKQPNDAETLPPSSLSEFKSALRAELHETEKALSHIQINPKRVSYIIEIADAIGSLKKTARLHESMSLHETFRQIEKTLNDVADRVDDKTTSVEEPVRMALNQIFQIIMEWSQSPETVTPEGLEASLKAPVDLFHKHLSPAIQGEPKMERKESSGMQESSVVDLSRIVINMKSVNPDDFAIFKDESQYYLNSIDAILSHFEDAEPFSALKEIDQAIRAINTASRMMHLPFVNDLCGAYIRSIETILNKQLAVPPEFSAYYKTAQQYFRELIEVRPIPLTDWQRLISRLVDTEKEIRAIIETPEVPAERIMKKETPVFPDTPRGQAQPKPGERQWIDDLQSVITEFFPSGADTVTQKITQTQAITPTVHEPSESLIHGDLHTGLAESAEEIVPEIENYKPAVKKQTGTIQETATLGFDLLAAMVNPNTDLSKIKLPTYIDRLNVDPENTPEVSKKQLRQILRKNTDTVTLPETNAGGLGAGKLPASTSENSQTEQLQTKIRKIRLHEHKFADVDAELLDIFNQESESYFRLFDKSIKRLQANIKDESALKDIERVSHSIKSSARMLGFEKISGMAACVELITERYFEKEITFDDALLVLFDDIVKTLKILYKTEQVDITSIAERLTLLENKFAVPNLFTRYILGDIQKDSVSADASSENSDPTPVSANQTKTEETGENVQPESDATPTPYFEALGIDAEIIDIFKEEASTYFKQFDSAMKRLNADPKKIAGIRDVEKSAHSLKSSSRMIGLHKIASLAKPVEVIAERISKGLFIPDQAVLQLLEQTIQKLKTLSDGNDTDIESVLKSLTDLETSIPDSLPGISKTEPENETAIRSGLLVLDHDHDGNIEIPSNDKTQKRKSKKTAVQPFSDISFREDPILKHAEPQQDGLLDEMFINSKNENIGK